MKKIAKQSDYTKVLYLSDSRISIIVREQFSNKICTDTFNYRDTSIVIIAVMEGAYMFLSDVGKAIGQPHQTGFVQVQSYQGTQQKKLKMLYDTSIDLTDKYVLLIDEICDTGATFDFLVKHLKKKNPKVIRTAAFLCREGSDFTPDFVGKTVPKDLWFSGYGMDDLENKGRGDRAIYTLILNSKLENRE